MALCSSSQNPVSLFSKHIQNDRSLQQDRVVSSGRAQQGFRSRSAIPSQIEHEFTENNKLQTGQIDWHSQPLLLGYNVHQAQHTRQTLHNWTAEYSKHGGVVQQIDSRAYNLNPKEYMKFQQAHTLERKHDTRLMGNGMMDGYCSLATQTRKLTVRPRPWEYERSARPILIRDQSTYPTSSPGTASDHVLQNHDWDAAFAYLDSFHSHPRERRSNAEAFDVHPTQTEHGIMACSDSTDSSKQMFGLSPFKTPRYKFEVQNVFLQNQDAFTEGLKIIERDGNMSFATLAFEAACQQRPQDAHAWKMLGNVLADTEQEGRAIEAFTHSLNLGLKEDDVMMRLAVCYTNQAHNQDMYDILQDWLEKSYPEIAESVNEDSFSLERHLSLKVSYISAARLRPEGSAMDPNVQIALGILFFSTQEYQQAADCFEAAIAYTASTPHSSIQSHLLYTHYGACVGNMSKNDAAIAAYSLALKLKPNYARARYNLGIAHYMQGNPREGARHLLQRLRKEAMQIVRVGTSHGRLEELGGSRNEEQDDDDVYQGLRNCFTAMCRWDLAEKVGPGMDVGVLMKEIEL